MYGRYDLHRHPDIMALLIRRPQVRALIGEARPAGYGHPQTVVKLQNQATDRQVASHKQPHDLQYFSEATILNMLS